MANSVIDSLMAHRTIRTFQPRPVEPETLDIILRAGIRAPSANNMQHYSLLIVDDEQKRKALGVIHAPLAIVALVDQFRTRRWLEVNNALPAYNHRPNFLFLGLWDAILALHNIVVAAESLGLGACYIGRIQSTNVHELFAAPTYVFPAGMVCLGYPDEAPALRPRLPLEAVVHRNVYHQPSDEEIRRFFAERDATWETMSPERKEELIKQGAHNMAQVAAIQAFSDAVSAERSRGLLDNLARSGFVIADET